MKDPDHFRASEKSFRELSDRETTPRSLGQIPPWEFAAAWQVPRTARGEILNLETVQK